MDNNNQGNLFGSFEKRSLENDLETIQSIEGLEYIPDFITKEEEQTLLNDINKEQWLGDLKRRVQHYGYKYDYKKRTIDPKMFLGELPKWLSRFAERLVEQKFFKKLPDQIIVNEYEPGQGIGSHIDCEPCFEDTVISLSLSAPIVMNFKESRNSKNKIDVFLAPRSLVVLKGDARYKWFHGITGKKSDVFKGAKILRQKRLSLTFRKMIIN